MNITATFVNPHRVSASTSIKRDADPATVHYEYPAKASLKKRKIWQMYLKARKDVEDRLKPPIDFKQWDGDNAEACEYRSQYNKKWDEIHKEDIEINKKFIPLFTTERKRCYFCGKPMFLEDVIQSSFNNAMMDFCNDDHVVAFSKLELAAQEKLLKKYTRKKKEKKIKAEPILPKTEEVGQVEAVS